MSQYRFDSARYLRSDAKAHWLRNDFDTASTLRTIAEEIDNLRAALSEARDFIMSGPRPGDEAAIVNKISAVLEGK